MSTNKALSTEDWGMVRSWYRANGRHYLPWRLESTPWKILLAETMLRRTRANQVARCFEDLAKKFDSPEKVFVSGRKWLSHSQYLGLTWRARLFLQLCKQLVDDHEGEVPRDTSELTNLPGVGHYTSAAVRCFGYGIPETLVDTNTIRLTGRITGVDLRTESHRNKSLREHVAKLGEETAGSGAQDNYALLDLAGIVCTKLHPSCCSCPVKDSCQFGSSFKES